MGAYVVAITGASGAVYGLRLVEELLNNGESVDLIISPAGEIILSEEYGLKAGTPGKAVREVASEYLAVKVKAGVGRLKTYPHDDLLSPVASGSALKRVMIICPCSMGTLGRIAAGVSQNLIDRSADCVLKEAGQLILVPRETPFNRIHLENMLKVESAGAKIVPAMPAFYTKPASVDDMVNFMVGKVLDLLGIKNDLYKRWDGKKE
ncbi:MAG: flavin prenyltransferase UbiX [Thermodesulfobacteriota bacterium]